MKLSFDIKPPTTMGYKIVRLLTVLHNGVESFLMELSYFYSMTYLFSQENC